LIPLDHCIGAVITLVLLLRWFCYCVGVGVGALQWLLVVEQRTTIWQPEQTWQIIVRKGATIVNSLFTPPNFPLLLPACNRLTVFSL
jgi:hypothetical protein